MNGLALKIGDAAKASGLTPKNIRYYEQIGLLPNVARHNGAARTGGNRLFRDSDVRRLRFIHNSRLLGLPLNDIAQLLRLMGPGICPGAHKKYREKLQLHLNLTAERIRQLTALHSELEGMISLSERGKLNGRCGCSTKPGISTVEFCSATPAPRASHTMKSVGDRR